MPGGLLDMFGIDPVANRQRKDAIMLQQLQNQGQLDVERVRGSNQISGIKAGGEQDRLTAAERAKFEQIIQKMVNDGQMSVEQARIAGQIANTRAQGDESRKTEMTRGSESRKTQAEGANQAKELAGVQSANTQKEKTLEQQLGILGKAGVPFSNENLQTFDRALTDPRIRSELQAVTQMTQARQNPAFQETLEQGMQAQNLAPVFQNIKTGTVDAMPGQMVATPPSGITLPPTDLNQYNVMQGATENQTIEETPSPYPGIPGQAKVVRQQMPGRIRLNPKIMQQAAQAVPQASVTPQYDINQLLRGAGVIPMPPIY